MRTEAISSSEQVPNHPVALRPPVAPVIALGLALLAVLAAFAFHSLLEHQARVAERSERLAADGGARIEELLARSRMLPATIFSVATNAYGANGLAEGLRELMRIHGLASAVFIEPVGQQSMVIPRDAGAWKGALPRFERGLSQALGAPQVSVDGNQLRVSQAVMAGEGAQQRFWGYVGIRVAMKDLVHELQLPALPDAGYDAQLILQTDRTTAPVVLFDGLGDAGGASRFIALPRGGFMRFTVGPTSGAPNDLSLLLAGLLAAAAVLALAAVLLRLRPSPPAQAVARASRDLEQEKRARLLAEEYLDRSHAMLDSMLEHFPGLVVIKRADDLRVMRVSQAAEDILGRHRDTLIGRSSEEIYAPEFAEKMHATDRQALSDDGIVEMPLEEVAMPGRESRWLRYRKLALRDRSGAARYVLEFGEDLTERERLYRARQEQVHFVEQLLDAIPGPLFYKDIEGRYLGVNAAFETFYGKSRESFVGRTVYDVAPPDLAAVYDEADRALLADGATQVYESSVQRADGSVAEVIFHKAVFRSKDGRQGGIVGIALDISERKAAERRVQQLNRILTVLGEASHLIMHIRERDELLRRVVALLRERGDFPVAWASIDGEIAPLVLAEPRIADTVARLLDALGRSDPPRRQLGGVHRRLLATVSPVAAAELREAGLDTMIRLPLEFQGAVRGQIGILGSEADLASEDACRLFEELAGNLSRALDTLEQEQARRAAEQKLQLAGQIFENNAEGIIVSDASNRIVMVNKAFTQLTGYSADEVIGRNPGMLKSGRQDEQFYRDLWLSLRLKGEWRGEIVNRRKNGEHYPEFLTISVVRDNAGEVTHYVAVFADLTARKEVEERLEFLAHYDALTALPNRILFTDRLNRAIAQARRAGQRVALYFLDLDRFSLVNDTFGHAGGDRLLQEVSSRLQGVVSEHGSVSRLGGDEFAIFSEGLASDDDADAFARRIQEALRQPLLWDDHEIHVSASIGVSIFPGDGKDADELAKNADSAMYQAIADGGNTVRFFHQAMNEHSFRRIQLEGRLHHALDRGEFEVYFQPQVEAASGRIIGAEALLRWFHADHAGAAGPTTFIPLLEETGLICAVGEWVLRRAMEEAVKWREISGEDMSVAVNLSATQLSDDDLPRRVGVMLAETGLRSASLEIELTESAVMRDTDRGIRLLENFRQLGVELSVDDFGTGYSSLSYLKRLPITTLKIDRSFVADIPDDEQATTIARAIIAMGHSLGLQIIAEGVESPAQARILRDAGTDIFQGYFFARPMSGDDFRQLLRAQAGGAVRAPVQQRHRVPARVAGSV